MSTTRQTLIPLRMPTLLSAPAYTEETAWGRNMRAGVHAQRQDRWQDAEQHFSAAISEVKNSSSKALNLATSLHALAELYRRQGAYSKAEPLYEYELSIREQTLGDGHPDIAATLFAMAALCHAQGRYGVVEMLYQRALQALKKTLGPDHPYVGTVLRRYAALLRKTDRVDEAISMESRLQQIQAKRRTQVRYQSFLLPSRRAHLNVLAAHS